jgi:hypothetical protein
MSFFKEEYFKGAKRLPSNFITGFLEVRPLRETAYIRLPTLTDKHSTGPQLDTASNTLVLPVNTKIKNSLPDPTSSYLLRSEVVVSPRMPRLS